MKTAIQLVLIYFGFLQILAPMLMVVPCIIYLLATTGAVDKDSLMQMIIIPAQMTNPVDGNLSLESRLYK